MIEGYFEFTISCYLQIIKPLDSKSGEQISIVIGYLGIILVLALPLSIMILLFQSIDSLKKESWMKRFGSLYEGLKTNNKLELSFYLLFLLRRIIFIITIFFLYEHNIIQLMICLFMNLIMLIY